MDDWREIFLNCREQIISRAFLVSARNRKNHPPMAPQKIRAPRAAAFRLQHFFPRRAEFAQARKTRNDNFIFQITRHPRIAQNNFANQLPVNFIAGNFLVRIKARVTQKLPRRARQHKTAERVVRFWSAPGKSGFTRRRVELVFPKQFVRKREAVARELKSSWSFLCHAICWRESMVAPPN